MRSSIDLPQHPDLRSISRSLPASKNNLRSDTAALRRAVWPRRPGHSVSESLAALWRAVRPRWSNHCGDGSPSPAGCAALIHAARSRLLLLRTLRWPRIRWPFHGSDDGDGGRGSGGLAIESPSATNYSFLDFARSTKGKNRRTMGLGLMAPFFLLLLLVLGSGAVVQDKSVLGDYVLDLQTREAQDSGPIYKKQITSSKIIVPVKRGSPLCSVCENVANKAVSYFGEKQTQDDIMEILHGACSQIFSLKQKCVEMVDSYATLLFAKISEIKPVKFCKQYGICKNMASLHVPGVKSESTCEFCHHLVDEVLSKMKDPDAQFEIIQLLIKECNKVQGHVQQCKRVVLEYIPLIMVNGEKFLEKMGVCSLIQACDASQKRTSGSFPDPQGALLSDA